MTMPPRTDISCFTTDALPPQERFAVWKDSIAVLFDVRRTVPSPETMNPDDDFRATLVTVQFGPMLLAETAATGHDFHRDLARASADGIDHFLIQLYCEGSAQLRFYDAERSITVGDVVLIDMSQPSSFLCSTFRNLTLVVPRPLLESRVPGAERLHGHVLHRKEMTTTLLAENLKLMWPLATSHDPAGIRLAAAAMLGLVTCCLASTTSTLPEAVPELKVATLMNVKRFLETHIDDPRLGPDSVLRSFRMSRAYLYKLFAPYGGVVHYVQRRRLTRSLAALQDPANRGRKIADIAFAHGFQSESAFSRAFRKAFGMTPSEARDTPPVHSAPPRDRPLVDRRYEDWLRRI